jgi:anoctamin-10
MITGARDDGGAGITPKFGEWENVEAVFPLHNQVKNKQWINDWSRKTILMPQDLDDIRNAMGEKV